MVAIKIKIAMRSNLTPLMNTNVETTGQKETIQVEFDSLTKRKYLDLSFIHFPY
jgi:hypothetical protein